MNRQRNARARRGAAAVVVTLAAAVMLATAASAQQAAPGPSDGAPGGGGPGARLAGAGTTVLEEGFPPRFAGDRVLVSVDARNLADGSASGHFAIVHRTAAGDLFADLRVEVTCLEVRGEHAVLTGEITRARTPGLPDDDVREGMVAGLVIRDGGPAGGDRMAWAFGEAGPSCTDLPAETAADVEQGNFVVRGW